ncbi:MAG: hypothetical protein M1602_03725, partial [Firmicutes bacterium]|nr:hypothetical protein [Bacillota bacterium]
ASLGYEPSDVRVSGIIVFLTAMAIFVAVVGVLSYGIGKVINADGSTLPTFGVLVNGHNIKYLQGLSTLVKEGDTLHLSVVPFPHKRAS